MGLHFNQEGLAVVVNDVEPLLREHYDESSTDKAVLPLDPDWPHYYVLEEMGMLKVFTVRSGGELVGYAAFFVWPHHHSRKVKIAVCDVIFLRPSYRIGAGVCRFLRFIEQRLAACHVKKTMFTVKTHVDWSPLLERVGYRLEEVGFTKVLGV